MTSFLYWFCGPDLENDSFHCDYISPISWSAATQTAPPSPSSSPLPSTGVDCFGVEHNCQKELSLCLSVSQSEYLIPRLCRERRALNAYKVIDPEDIDPRAQEQKSSAYPRFLLLSIAFYPDAQVTSPANPRSQAQLPALRALSHYRIFSSQGFPPLSSCSKAPFPASSVLAIHWIPKHFSSFGFFQKAKMWEL